MQIKQKMLQMKEQLRPQIPKVAEGTREKQGMFAGCLTNPKLHQTAETS